MCPYILSFVLFYKTVCYFKYYFWFNLFIFNILYCHISYFSISHNKSSFAQVDYSIRVFYRKFVTIQNVQMYNQHSFLVYLFRVSKKTLYNWKTNFLKASQRETDNNMLSDLAVSVQYNYYRSSTECLKKKTKKFEESFHRNITILFIVLIHKWKIIVINITYCQYFGCFTNLWK